jgi:hypothetical protein
VCGESNRWKGRRVARESCSRLIEHANTVLLLL